MSWHRIKKLSHTFVYAEPFSTVEGNPYRRWPMLKVIKLKLSKD